LYNILGAIKNCQGQRGCDTCKWRWIASSRKGNKKWTHICCTDAASSTI